MYVRYQLAERSEARINNTKINAENLPLLNVPLLGVFSINLALIIWGTYVATYDRHTCIVDPLNRKGTTVEFGDVQTKLILKLMAELTARNA